MKAYLLQGYDAFFFIGEQLLALPIALRREREWIKQMKML
jgi:hypothetical protein